MRQLGPEDVLLSEDGTRFIAAPLRFLVLTRHKLPVDWSAVEDFIDKARHKQHAQNAKRVLALGPDDPFAGLRRRLGATVDEEYGKPWRAIDHVVTEPPLIAPHCRTCGEP